MKPFIVTLCLGSAVGGLSAQAPVADYHQHLFSPAAVALLATPTSTPKPITARDLIPLLDSAGIRNALILSVAYMYGSPARTVDSEYAKVRAENDWAAAQAAEYPDRLRAFCSFNPLKDYAIDELARCAATPDLRYGIKLHFGNSDVQLDNPAHLEQLRRVFRAANTHGMAIVVHMRASVNRHRPYGAAQARAFLEQLLPLVPDVPVQIAHLAGAGGYDDPAADSAMAVFAAAVGRGDPRTKHLWFDVTSVAAGNITLANAALAVRRIRQVGVDRVLYGSDAPAGDNLRPREGWAQFRKLPLTSAEFERIAWNVTAYVSASIPLWQPTPGHTQVPLWPGSPPGTPPSSEEVEIVSTTSSDGLVAGRPWSYINNVSKPTLTVYSPEGANTGAAVVVFPGGGYQILAIDLEGTEVCDWLAAKGITCVLLKYRVPAGGPSWDQQCGCDRKTKSSMALEDAQRTISLVRHHAAEWHVDPHKIGVLGFSAGGHMVATTSTHFDRRVYRAVDSADQESPRPDFAVAVYPGHLSHYAKDSLAAALHVTHNAPPTFILQAENDNVDAVTNSLSYYEALKNAKVPVELHLYAEGGHAFGLRPTRFPITRWPRLVETWLATIGMIAPREGQ